MGRRPNLVELAAQLRKDAEELDRWSEEIARRQDGRARISRLLELLGECEQAIEGWYAAFPEMEGDPDLLQRIHKETGRE